MEPVAPLISKFLLVEKEPVEVFILALVEVISYNVPCQLALAKLLSDWYSVAPSEKVVGILGFPVKLIVNAWLTTWKPPAVKSWGNSVAPL